MKSDEIYHFKRCQELEDTSICICDEIEEELEVLKQDQAENEATGN